MSTIYKCPAKTRSKSGRVSLTCRTLPRRKNNTLGILLGFVQYFCAFERNTICAWHANHTCVHYRAVARGLKLYFAIVRRRRPLRFVLPCPAPTYFSDDIITISYTFLYPFFFPARQSGPIHAIAELICELFRLTFRSAHEII